MTKDLMDPTELNTMDERSRDEYFMGLAIEEGKKAYALGEIPIGAILVHDNQVISRHHNRRELDHDATAHAEVLVIREACNSLKRWRLTGCTLYVTIEPCPMCAGAIVQARIPRVVIGCMNPKAGCAGSVLDMLHEEGFNHQVQTDINVCQEECSGMLSRFFKDLRKKRAELKAQKQLQDADPEKAE